MIKEGYIQSFEVIKEKNLLLSINLKYHENKPVVEMLQRVSRPGLRIYKAAKNLPKVLGGFGTTIISTSKGLMSDREASKKGLGGEIICYVA